jgi:FxsC-like protein
MRTDRLREVLAAADVDTTVTNLAECLWLACHLPAGQPSDLDAAPANEGDRGPAGRWPSLARRARTSRAPARGPAAGALYLAGAQPQADTAARDVQVPTPPMLDDVLPLQRALRPVKRRVAAGPRQTVDEKATAERIAETGCWYPVLVAEPQRWLDLAFVVDTGPSMALWRPMVHELREALSQLGAFRDVRVFYLVDGRVATSLTGPKRDPATVVDPAGRRAVLVLSDCSGRQWWNGRAASAVHAWARRGPTAILQPLPERLWPRTAAATVPGTARSVVPGAPNPGLIFVPDADQSPPAGSVPVPVLELGLEPIWLADWARLVSNPDQGPIRTAVTYVAARPAAADARVSDETALGVDDRVRRFQAVASPQARRLAAYIAVSIPALPVMRLIQRTMLPGSRPGHLAEVLLSGLLRPRGGDRYEFVDEQVRKSLLAVLPRSESWHAVTVLQRISAEIERRAGAAGETFPALLEIRDQPSDPGIDPDAARFALVSPLATQLLSHLAVPLATPPVQPSPRPAAGRAVVRRRLQQDAPYFFLSYPRTPRQGPDDDPDRWVYKLYRDVCDHILQLTDVMPEAAGFMDRETRLGAEWSAQLGSALATCRVFVPLYSPRYFQSEACGKEWFAFARRTLIHQARGSNAGTPIVPALWAPVRPEGLPEAARAIQFDPGSMGPRYRELGFYGIMKLTRFRRDYQQAVFRLAQVIVDVAERSRLGPEPPADYGSLQNAFGTVGVANPDLRQLRIVVVAPDAASLPGNRSRDYYGARPRDWRPYLPDYPQPIADYCADLARSLGYQPVINTLDEYLDDEHLTDYPGLFLVDPWMAVSAGGRTTLARIDDIDAPWTTVLVPWNRDDAELVRAEGEIRNSLEYSMSRQLTAARSDWLAPSLAGIATLPEFSNVCAAVTAALYRRFLRTAEAHPPAGPVIERPRLRQADPEGFGEER